MSIRAVLVTGGAGFIASHIVDAYIAQGLEVTVLDNLSSGVRANVNMRAKFVHGVDVVNHHAAQIDVRKSVGDPAFDAETNVVGSLRLLSQIGGGQAIPPVLPRRAAASLTLRMREAFVRALPLLLLADLRRPVCGVALRERLRPAPAQRRRGRRGGHLHRQTAGRRNRNDQRRRQTDARARSTSAPVSRRRS